VTRDSFLSRLPIIFLELGDPENAQGIPALMMLLRDRSTMRMGDVWVERWRVRTHVDLIFNANYKCKIQCFVMRSVICMLHIFAYCWATPLVIDSVKFVRPDDFDVLLTDMAESDLHLMAQLEGVGYLNVSNAEPLFPVEGLIMGAHRRFMVNLLVRRRAAAYSDNYRNVIFMVDTGSPYTFLSAAAMSALVGPDKNVPSMMRLEIHGNQSIVCYLSPPDKHFAEINLLGMDFLEMKRAQLDVDWTQKTFQMNAD
jgi:hypothetical protein